MAKGRGGKGHTELRGTCGRGDERQIHRYEKGKPNGEMGHADRGIFLVTGIFGSAGPSMVARGQVSEGFGP